MLNEKQQRFADEYLIDLNATQAAIRAGYSKRTANEQGARLLANVSVQEYISKRMEEKEKDLIASQDEVLQTLTRVLRRQEKEFVVSSEKISRTYYDSNGKKCTETRETPVVVDVPTRVSDLNKAAELIGRRYQLYTDKVKVDGNMPVMIVDDLDG